MENEKLIIKMLKGLPLICCAILLSACQNDVLDTVRKVTYPPDFNYISSDDLHDTMQSFAWYTTLLDNNLRDTSKVTKEQRLSAIDILGKMEKLSHELGSASLSSNHNIVSLNIDLFRQRIVDARIGLQQEPPNYYLVGSVSAYCLNCHSRK